MFHHDPHTVPISLEEKLDEACMNGKSVEVQRLIDEGVDVNYSDFFGNTPLMMASTFGCVDTVRLLLDHGADINAKKDDGNTALHRAAYNGNDDVVRFLIKRGADLHAEDDSNYTPFDDAKQRWNEPSTAAIVEAAIKSTKVIYTAYDDLQQQKDGFTDFNKNIIILSDNDIPDEYEFGGHPVFSLRHILLQCIDQLPPHIENAITTRLQHWEMNILHLIAYLPREILFNDTTMYEAEEEAILSVLTMYSQHTTAVDMDGMTPLHHATINLSKKKTSQECHDVLLARSSPIVVHKAIEAGLDWEYLHPIVMAKLNALTMEDEESGLVPFMFAAMKCNNDHVDGVLGSLSVVYELLCLKPDAMKEYDVSIMMKKRVLDGRTSSTSTDSSDRYTKRARGV